jgi:hypothetical protein
MLRLELTDEEQRVLAELLETDIGDFRLEIADTDIAEFREMLKQREQVLKHLLAQVRAAPIRG